MKTRALTAVMVLLTVLGVAQAVAQGARSDGGPGNRPPPGGQGRENEQALTDTQVAKIKEILSAYDPGSLTAETARAIHEAFRAAGIRPGRGMKEAIEAAGFDAERLRELDPPPDREGEGAQGGGRRGPQGQGSRGPDQPNENR